MRILKRKEKIFLIQVVVFLAAAVITFLSCSVTAQALLQIGAQPPDFSLKDLDGNTVNLSQYSRKKAVILLFWSTWSLNSPKALKRFEEFHRKYKDRGVQVIGINADNQTISNEDTENIRKLVGELGISFPVLLDRGLNTFHDYQTIALPSTLVISGGRISYALPGLPLVGAEDMFDYLLVLAGEQPRKKAEPKYQPRYEAIAETGLALQFAHKGQYEMAYLTFRKAIGKDPKYLLPYGEMAKLYETNGKNAEAEEVLRSALAVEPDNPVISSELGHLLSKTGRMREAVGILENIAKRENGSYTPAHYYLGYALGMGGKLKEALGEFGQAASLNPYDPALYRLRAEVYEKNSMLKEAAADYRKALELIMRIKK